MTTPIAASTAAAPSTSTSGALAGLDGQAFLELLVAQLRYQNPMAPSDPAAMLQQTAQLRQVETLQELATSQQEVARMQEASMAAGLVGKQVDALDAEGAAVTGAVDSVRFSAAGPVLLVGGREVAFANILGIAAGTDSTSN